MQLFKRSWEFFGWFGAVLSVFLRTHPVLTPALVLARATAQITQLLAFFIPLKVLLLLASPGVPRYFRFFIDSEDRTGWVIGLSMGAVVAYLVTVLLDRLSDVLSEIGSRDLLQQSSQLSVIANQREVAKRYYSSFSRLAANLLLIAAIFAAGFFLYAPLFSFLAGFILLQLIVSWAALRAVDPVEPAGFGGYIFHSTKRFLGYLETVTFLAVFAFLVVDFVVYGGVNVLIAILCFLLTRRLLSSLCSFVSEATMLARQRHRIDPLVFLEEKHVKKQPGAQLKLSRYFQVSDRQPRLTQALAIAGVSDVATVQSRWLDPGPSAPGIYQFEVAGCNSEGGAEFYGLEQVVGQDPQQTLENEALIVEHLGRGTLCMAETLHEYQLGPFQCRLLDLRGARRISGRDWKSGLHAQLLLHLWSIDPGGELTRIFELAKPYVHERLTLESLERLEVAVDTAEKERTYLATREHLATALEVVAGLPLFPLNRRLTSKTVFIAEDQRFLVTDWGRWSLEPVGSGLDSQHINEAMAGKLTELLRHRRYSAEAPTLPQLRLAANVYRFEDQLLARGRFNEALRLADGIIQCVRESAHGVEANRGTTSTRLASNA